MVERSIGDKARILVNKYESDPGVASLMNKVRRYSNITFAHSVNVAYLTAQIMLLDGVEKDIARQYITGAMLHDVGKLNIPISIIEKKGTLSDDEFIKIKMHPSEGMSVIRENCPDILTPIIEEIVLFHHEKTDGKGYPTGRMYPPEHAMLISAIDSYDAMTADRPYNKVRRSTEEAIATLEGMGYDRKFLEKIAACNVK